MAKFHGGPEGQIDSFVPFGIVDAHVSRSSQKLGMLADGGIVGLVTRICANAVGAGTQEQGRTSIGFSS